MTDLELWLVHPDAEACAAFDHRFAGLPRVTVRQATYEQLPPHDCFVTAANAFGMMTAGIDGVLVEVHGQQLMDGIQARIVGEWRGEQPVGTAFVHPTGTPSQPWVVHAPTMRVPAGIDGTDKVYAATWAALCAIADHNERGQDATITTVALPAMGTGFGGVPFDEAARQMAVAYEHHLDPPPHLDWDVVRARHRRICWDGDTRVVP
jgi:O-acetyl-ADP-ribose deacetylase (regulator of RNase III)